MHLHVSSWFGTFLPGGVSRTPSLLTWHPHHAPSHPLWELWLTWTNLAPTYCPGAPGLSVGAQWLGCRPSFFFFFFFFCFWSIYVPSVSLNVLILKLEERQLWTWNEVSPCRCVLGHNHTWNVGYLPHSNPFSLGPHCGLGGRDHSRWGHWALGEKWQAQGHTVPQEQGSESNPGPQISDPTCDLQ